MDFEKFYSSINLEAASFLLSGIFIGAVIVYLALSMNAVGGDTAAQNLVPVLENQSGQNLEVVNVEREKGLYRLDLRGSKDRLLTYYVTEDGSSFTRSITSIRSLDEAVKAREDFRDCLENKGVVLYGNLSQRLTRSQIQLLGGERTVAPIYRDVSGNETLVEAVQNGVQKVPAFYYNGSVLSGLNSLNEIERFTGCRYEVDQN